MNQGLKPSAYFSQLDPAWLHPVCRPEFNSLRRVKPRARIAVVVHIYYRDLWPEILRSIRNIEEPYDLFVTLVARAADSLEEAVVSHFPSAKVLIVDNHGRDILPFLLLLRTKALYKYELVCKVHTKRSLWHHDGESWRRELITGILGDPMTIRHILNAFRENAYIGIVVADKQVYRGRELWVGNRQHLERLFPHFSMDETAFDKPFAGGSMFWIRPSLLRALDNLPVDFDDFELEPLGPDGALAHGIERLISLLCYDAGMTIEETSGILKLRSCEPRLGSPTQTADREGGAHNDRQAVGTAEEPGRQVGRSPLSHIPDLFWSPSQDAEQDVRIGDFRQFIRTSVERSWKAVEIGPSLNPIIPKRLGFDVTVVDHGTAEEIAAKYHQQGLDISQIEPVDVVWTSGKLTDALAGRPKFSAIVASHVIEHIPDFIGFLQSCTSLLADNGRVFLIVPDRRFCFDFFHTSTDVAKVIGDHHKHRSRHSFESFFRNSTNVRASIKGIETIAWGPHEIDDICLLGSDPKQTLESSFRNSHAEEYIDSHENYFTPMSFVLLMEELRYLGLAELLPVLVTRTRGCEFLVILSAQGAQPNLSTDTYLACKKWLLLSMLREERERFQYLGRLLDSGN